MEWSTELVDVSAAPIEYRVVETVDGPWRGVVIDDVATFTGIRYGAPTGGNNRFRPPQPLDSWTEARDALEFGPQCPQVNLDLPVWLDSAPQSEDCLCLNVWAPADASSRLPVVVWLHGGAYVFGSAGAPFYDGSGISAASDVVVVSINHRLNVFGYTYLGDDVDSGFEASGNAGQLDIVAALHWVQDNIENFGGNPGDVTVFGQSGGGGKVMTLLSMEAAQGLFHKAAILSGAPLHAVQVDTAEALTSDLYRHLGLDVGDIESLQAAPVESLLDFVGQLMFVGDQFAPPSSDGDLPPVMKYGPVADGKILSTTSWVYGAPETARNVPLLIGNDLHETIGLIASTPGELDAESANDEDLARRIARYGAIGHTVDPDEIVDVLATYRQALPEFTQADLVVRVSTDIGFWNFVLQLATAKALQSAAPVFVFECRWTTPCFDGMWAPHGVELPFFFNRPRYASAWDGEDSEATRDAADPTGRRFDVGSEFFRAWIAFIRNGDPSTEDRSWPAYEIDSRPTMIIDEHPHIENDVRSQMRSAVTSLTNA